MASADQICPAYVGDERIRLELARPLDVPAAFQVVEVLVDYAAALPEGVACPIEFSVSPPTRSRGRTVVYRRRAPRSVSFVPREGGSHLIRVRELTHNRWLGTLVVDVVGDSGRPRRDEGEG